MSEVDYRTLFTQDLDGWQEWSLRQLDTIDLDGIDHCDAVLPPVVANVRLRGAQLARTRIGVLTNVDLSNSNLESATMSSTLRGVDLSGANLRGARLQGVSLSDVDLSGTDLTDAVLEPITVNDVLYDESTRWPTGHHCDRGGVLGPRVVYDDFPGWYIDDVFPHQIGTDTAVPIGEHAPDISAWFAAIYHNCGMACCGNNAFDSRVVEIRRRMGLNAEWAGPAGNFVYLSEPPAKMAADDASTAQRALDVIDQFRDAAKALREMEATEVYWKEIGIRQRAIDLAGLFAHIAEALSVTYLDDSRHLGINQRTLRSRI